MSIWEIVVNTQIGKLTAPEDLAGGIERQGFLVLPFAMEHAVEIKSLPRIHADPFDRALIAQAREPA
jgi:PIN domain nuclease of toxin-antitoxin system